MIEPLLCDLPVSGLADWGYGMTVCIAAITSDNLIVTVADKKLSTGMFSADSSVVKTRGFHREWVAMIAGDDVSHALPIIRRAASLFSGKENYFEHAVDALKNGYKQELSQHAADVVLGRFDLTMENFLENGTSKFTPDVFDTLCDQIGRVDLKCRFLVAGFDEREGPHIFTISSPGIAETYDLPGFWAIGSGSQSALGMLFFRGQNSLMSLAETVYNCFEAKFMSESARDVGQDTYLFVQKYGCNTCKYSVTLQARIREIWERSGKPRVPKRALKIIEDSNIMCAKDDDF
jgi:20S proteasome alpha/beta subunit